MELAQENLIKIATVSQELRKILKDAKTQGVNGPDITRAKFWLDQIQVTSREILETLNRCTTSDNDSTLDQQLEGWISANGPVICLMTLNEMKRMINFSHPEKTVIGFISSAFGVNPSPAGDRIHEAIKVLDNYRHYFDYLLASGVWNSETDALHRSNAVSPVLLQMNASASSFTSGKGIQYKKQGWMGVRNAGITRRKSHSSYSSLNPSQETMVDELGKEEFDCSSTANTESVCHGSNTEMDSTATNIHKTQGRRPRPNVIVAGSSKDNINVSHKTEDIEKGTRNRVDLEKLDLILQWLDAFRCFEKHRVTLSLRQTDTCTWLPETNEYKAWLAGENSFLWLHGKAGCGKSVLVASVIERLEKTFVDEPPSFFYCDFGKERSMDAAEVIRSLLYQLVDQYRQGRVRPSAPQVINELMDERRKGDTALRDITCLSSLVSCVAGQFNRPPLLVIDALDECKDIDHLLCALLRLKTNGVRLFVSSRPVQVIKHRFSRFPCISVDKMVEAVSADIVLHVNREIDSHPRLGLLDPVLKKKAHSTLCQKADGMFRWVQCQLDTLKGCFTLQEFHGALNNLPMGLDATYERILLGIDQRPSEAKIAQYTLAWLVTTSRPLILREVIEALSIDLRRRIFDQGNAPIHKYALLDALGSLVVHDEETDIINLSHFSVKEYLLDELIRKRMPTYHINLQAAHKQVFQLCMCYLVASLPHFDDHETAQSRPLLDYVFSCGFDHLAHLEPTDDAILDSMVTLQSEILKHPEEWKHMCRLASLYHPYKSWITPEHDFVICILISMFPEPFLHAFLRRAPRKTKYSSNPLVHTVHFDKVDHARTLLSYGVDVNCAGWDIDGLRHNTRLPLEVALRRENSVLVDLFLKEGSAAISRKVYSTIFDAHHCDYPPHIVSSLLQADEFVEWASEVHDAEFLQRPLNRDRYRRHQVTEKDLLVMMRRLVQVGHDISSPLDSSKQILLLVAFAASGEYPSLLEYLLSINAPMPSGILFAGQNKPLVSNHTLQGIDVKAVAADGDTMLHQVLGHCTGGSRCWVLSCNLCSSFRYALLIALGQEGERTLTKILAISRELIATLENAGKRKIGNPETSRVLSQLEKVVLASGSLLQEMNQDFLGKSTINYHSKRWLSGKGPEACLEILQRMMELASDTSKETVVDLEGRSHSDESCPMPSEDKIHDAIALFNRQESQFHFLLAVVVKSVADSQHPHPVTVPGVDQDEDALTSTTSTTAQVKRLQNTKVVQDINERFDRSSESPTEIDVLFVGQTGVGKSSLINMIMGIPGHSDAAAKVSNDAHPCTTHTTCYPVSLQTGLRCQLWDTRGLDEGAEIHDRRFMAKIFDKIRQLASQQARELKETLRDRTRLAIPILIWCVDATKIESTVHWQQLHKVYVDYCERRAIPVIVITRGPPKVSEWETRCREQLRQLDLGIDIPILMVRRYRNPSSLEYVEDSRALRDLISHLAVSRTMSSRQL